MKYYILFLAFTLYGSLFGQNKEIESHELASISYKQVKSENLALKDSIESLNNRLSLLSSNVDLLMSERGKVDTAYNYATSLDTFSIFIGGDFQVDNNEFDGWSSIGWIDNTNRADLGNSLVPNISATAGGYSFDYDVRIIGVHMKIRGSGTNMKDTKVRMVRQLKQGGGTNDRINTEMYLQPDFITGLSNAGWQIIDLDIDAEIDGLGELVYPNGILLPQGETLVFGVDTPNQANGTSGRRIQCGDCYIIATRQKKL